MDRSRRRRQLVVGGSQIHNMKLWPEMKAKSSSHAIACKVSYLCIMYVSMYVCWQQKLQFKRMQNYYYYYCNLHVNTYITGLCLASHSFPFIRPSVRLSIPVPLTAPSFNTTGAACMHLLPRQYYNTKAGEGGCALGRR